MPSHQRGHIRKRVSAKGTESWQVIVSYRVNGQRRTLSETFPKKSMAQKRLPQLLDRAEALATAKSSGCRTIGDLMTRFEEEEVGDWSPSTQRQWASASTRHFIPAWGLREIGSVTVAEVEDWMRDLRAGKATAVRPLERSTVARLRTMMIAAYDRAVRLEYVTSNPFRMAKLARARMSADIEEDDDETFPDPAAVLAVLAEAKRNSETFAACQLAADTGMRRGEICGLRFKDIDWASGVLRIRRRAIIGPGDKIVVRQRTKANKGRSILLAEATVEMLATHRDLMRAQASEWGLRWSDNAFAFSAPGEPFEPMRPDSLSARWERCCERAGQSIRFHDLRHMNVSVLFAAGIDLATIAERLGHSGGGRMTLATYAHKLREVERIAAEVAAEAMRPRTQVDDRQIGETSDG